MRIDLVVSPSHAVDNSVAILKRLGHSNARWPPVAIAMCWRPRRAALDHRHPNPRRAGEVVAVLPLEDVAISTRATTNGFRRRRRSLHHLIDPRTAGSPSSRAQRDHPRRAGSRLEGLSKCLYS